MYTQETANIFDHIQDHSRLDLENKFLKNKSGRTFLRSTGLLYKFLPTNLGVCKPTFSPFYTSHQSCPFCETIQKIAKIAHTASRFSLLVRAVIVVKCLNEL